MIQCCAAGCSDDPDAFDGRCFCRAPARSMSSSSDSVLSCRPCSSAAEQVIDSNADVQKYAFSKVKGRWGDNKEDQFTKPIGGRRDVVATGMNRFEIGKDAPPQAPWEQLSPNVICVLAFNPSAFTLNGTNCYLVGTGKKRVLIDTGEKTVGHEKFIETLKQCMAANGIEGLQEILITHWHHDHYGGIPGLLTEFGDNIPIRKLPNPPQYWTTVDNLMKRGLIPYLEHPDGTLRYKPDLTTIGAGTVVPGDCMVEWPDAEAEAGKILSWDPAMRTKSEMVRDYYFLKTSWTFGKHLENNCNYQVLSHGDIVRTEGASLMACHTPGHSMDHCSYWLQEEKSLFSGDHVLGWGTTFIADLYDYMSTLQFMIALKPVHLYPGHGPMIEDGMGLLERYILHRKTREDQVEDVLLQNPEPLGCSRIVEIIYVDTPKQRLWMAEENVQKVLRKFDKSGLAIPFILQDDGTLERYYFPSNVTMIRRMPERLVWLHRFHFRAETRGHVLSSAKL